MLQVGTEAKWCKESPCLASALLIVLEQCDPRTFAEPSQALMECAGLFAIISASTPRLKPFKLCEYPTTSSPLSFEFHMEQARRQDSVLLTLAQPCITFEHMVGSVT